MASQETKSPKNPSREANGILSPGFRSAAAMAGWLLLASLVVEDTPIRESRHKKRPNHHNLKSPASTNSNRKRRSKRRQADDLMPAVVLCLDDEEEDAKKDVGVKKNGAGKVVVDDGDREKKMKGEENFGENASSSDNNNNKGLPCMDRLREELSCAICLEICFEPSTTPCGHSFCQKCLKCAAAKCGKRCPKCRQLISNGRSCTVNTVLWNTIQLLFPSEIEARKSTLSAGPRTPDSRNIIYETGRYRLRIIDARNTQRSTSFGTATQVSHSTERERSSSRRRASPGQSQDAALALRLQREEFLGTSIDAIEQPRSSLHSARANLRAMASRAYHIRSRGRY
ncbi:uncharacterized protein A4U43_C09F2100 [Asparagus officinalis]|uniref:RING-type E3 ubiquitin transferase n=1 Tax=Asparagus officinalis TaxID=4686 RepID=A0A5P1E7Y6_ASPOF|nr:tripartite motif-containing protein 65-like [Asparagus officinalis]ONK57595.1 uncharacterized protein A4U43_C09F2100 [Asparagus officinalis]